MKYLADFIREEIPDVSTEETLVCATDAGGAKRTRKMADELHVGFMMADKFRSKVGDGDGQVKIISDVSMNPKSVIICDDMFDTCNSMVKVVEAVRTYVPQAKIYAVCSHGYFSKDAAEKISKMIQGGALEWVAVTNSI